MIQRSQSIYLFAVTVLMSILLFIPVVEFVINQEEILVLYGYGVKIYENGVDSHLFTAFPLVFLTLIICMISLVNIFFFRKRGLQLRLCVLNILLLLGLMGLSFFYYKYTKNQFTINIDNFKLGAVFPIIAIILTFLAFRGIRADEDLIRSYDRLR